MEWRITEDIRGGFNAEYGGYIKSGTAIGYMPGCFMPTFVVQESARFGTRRQAERYIEGRKRWCPTY